MPNQSNTYEARTITGLNEVESSILGVSACLHSKMRTHSSGPTTLSQQQSRNLQLQMQIDAESESTKVARDRVKYIRNPNANTSYYESWFPLNRPMKTSTVPILLGLSIFLITFFFLNLMSLLGIHLEFTLPEAWFLTRSMHGSGGSYRIPFYIVSVLLVISIGVSIYGIFRKT